MKKILFAFLSLLCLIPFCFGLTACKVSDGVIDLADCEIGYKLPIYPQCEFDYKISDECTVHINGIILTLVEKNTIQENTLLSETFRPFVFNLSATGYTDKSLYNKTFNLYLTNSVSSSNSTFYFSAQADENGTIVWDEPFYFNGNIQFYFNRITIK